jgi:hypothetical protein
VVVWGGKKATPAKALIPCCALQGGRGSRNLRKLLLLNFSPLWTQLQPPEAHKRLFLFIFFLFFFFNFCRLKNIYIVFKLLFSNQLYSIVKLFLGFCFGLFFFVVFGFLFCFYCWDSSHYYNPGWSGTCDHLASACQVLVLQVYTTIPC